MSLYSKDTNALTKDGKRFVRDALATALGCGRTMDDIEDGLIGMGFDDVLVDLDETGLKMSVCNRYTNHSEYIMLSDLGFNAESVELIGRRFLNCAQRLASLSDDDLALTYDACSDDYYDSDYGEYDDYDDCFDEFYHDQF